MKTKLIALLILIMGFQISAQDKILLADRVIKPKKDAPITLTYGIHENDKVILSLSTKKDKPIREIVIKLNGKVLFSGTNVSPTKDIEFTATETNFLNFYFYGKKPIDIKIERIPSSEENILFNPSIYQYKHYDTSYVEYEIDSVIGYDEIRTPKEFRVIASAEYESVELKTEQLTLKGGDKKGYIFTKPEKLKKTDDKEMKLMGYQVMITSEAGADKMWKNIGIGVDVACLAMSLFLPAGGTAAGLAVNQAFEMIGPQDGGEPVYYIITNTQKDLDKFTDDDINTKPLAYERGLATGYSGSWFAMDTLAVGLKNLNIAVEVEVVLVVSAIYQATIWETITQDIVTIKPKTVKVKRTRQVIKNTKRWNFEE